MRFYSHYYVFFVTYIIDANSSILFVKLLFLYKTFIDIATN